MNIKTITKLAAVAAMAVGAHATTISYDITGDHATGGLGTPPFGTVSLSETGTGPTTVTVHLVTGYSFVTTGAADDQYFKFNDGKAGASTADVSFGTAAMKANTGSFNGDGTGAFKFGIGPNPLNNGLNKYTGDIQFTVNATIGDLTGVANLIGGENIIFVADLISPNGNTGPAYVTTTTTKVPDGGATVALLGLGMFGLGAIRRKLS